MQYIKKAVSFSLRFFLNIWFGIPLLFLALVGMLKGKFMKKAVSYITRHFACAFAKVFSKFSRYYCLVEFLPKKAEDVTACNLLTDTKENEYAIVLQGPIVDKFTAETVRIYRKIFPKAVIIVSTWKGTNEKLAEELQGLADHMILSDPPKTSGIGNINYQAKSSYAGIKKAYELGIPYAMKTRVDQRINAPMVFEYMKSLLEAFPLDSKYSQWQKERIIVLPGGGIATPYYIADYFQFGTTQDILNFFDFPPDPVNCKNEVLFSLNRKYTDDKGRQRIRFMTEVQLIKSYVMRCGLANRQCTVKGYWEDIKGRFLVINRSALRLYWHKHKYYYLPVNFWRISETPNGQPTMDEDILFTSQLSLSLVNGHLLYDSKFEEYNKYAIEPFGNLGSFCLGYEHLDEILKEIAQLEAEDKH